MMMEDGMFSEVATERRMSVFRPLLDLGSNQSMGQ